MNRYRRIKKLVSPLALSLCVTLAAGFAIGCQSFALAEGSELSAMDLVKEHYASGNYRAALSKLATLPQNDVVHYYTGLCLQGQGQLTQARSHYNWVSYYSKNPRLKAIAQRAINTVDSYSSKRTYQGQGNRFARVNGGSSHGQPVVRRS